MMVCIGVRLRLLDSLTLDDDTILTSMTGSSTGGGEGGSTGGVGRSSQSLPLSSSLSNVR